MRTRWFPQFGSGHGVGFENTQAFLEGEDEIGIDILQDFKIILDAGLGIELAEQVEGIHFILHQTVAFCIPGEQPETANEGRSLGIGIQRMPGSLRRKRLQCF